MTQKTFTISVLLKAREQAKAVRDQQKLVQEFTKIKLVPAYQTLVTHFNPYSHAIPEKAECLENELKKITFPSSNHSFKQYPWYLSTKDFNKVFDVLLFLAKEMIYFNYYTSSRYKEKISKIISSFILNPKILNRDQLVKLMNTGADASWYGNTWSPEFLTRFNYQIPDEKDSEFDKVLLTFNLYQILDNSKNERACKVSNRHFLMFLTDETKKGRKYASIFYRLQPASLDVLPEAAKILRKDKRLRSLRWNFDFFKNPFWQNEETIMMFSEFAEDLYANLDRGFTDILSLLRDDTFDTLLLDHLKSQKYSQQTAIKHMKKLRGDISQLSIFLTHEGGGMRKAARKLLYGKVKDDGASEPELAIRYLKQIMNKVPNADWENIIGQDLADFIQDQ